MFAVRIRRQDESRGKVTAHVGVGCVIPPASDLLHGHRLWTLLCWVLEGDPHSWKEFFWGLCCPTSPRTHKQLLKIVFLIFLWQKKILPDL